MHNCVLMEIQVIHSKINLLCSKCFCTARAHATFHSGASQFHFTHRLHQKSNGGDRKGSAYSSTKSSTVSTADGGTATRTVTTSYSKPMPSRTVRTSVTTLVAKPRVKVWNASPASPEDTSTHIIVLELNFNQYYAVFRAEPWLFIMFLRFSELLKPIYTVLFRISWPIVDTNMVYRSERTGICGITSIKCMCIFSGRLKKRLRHFSTLPISLQRRAFRNPAIAPQLFLRYQSLY